MIIITVEQKDMSVKRKEWLDALRALAMIFVLLNHYLNGQAVILTIIAPIMIPLFFAITGYVFNDKRTSQLAFFKNLFFKLIIPWIVLTLPLELLAALAHIGDRTIGSVLYNFISGINLWYLPCLIIAEVIWFYVRRFLKNPKFVCLVALIIAAIGYVLSYYDILTFAMINRAMVAQFFFLIGYCYKLLRGKIDAIKWKYVIIQGIIYCGLIIIDIFAFRDNFIDVHNNIYPLLPFSLLEILSGCFFMFSLLEKIEKPPRFLTFIGRNTLTYYTLNGYFSGALIFLLSAINVKIPENFIISLGIILYICIGCAVVSVLINKFAPWIVGKRKKQKIDDKLKEDKLCN